MIDWANGKTSNVTGTITGSSIVVNAVDVGGTAIGLRADFVGTVSPDGKSMTGTGANDPNSPNGNDATLAWTAQ